MFPAAQGNIKEWCKGKRHLPVEQQLGTFSDRLLGHYAYCGVRGNSRSLGQLLNEVKRKWHYWLGRRSSKDADEANRWKWLDAHYPLPRARIAHGAIRQPA